MKKILLFLSLILFVSVIASCETNGDQNRNSDGGLRGQILNSTEFYG